MQHNTKKHTLNSFINNSNIIHNNKYDYSKGTLFPKRLLFPDLIRKKQKFK